MFSPINCIETYTLVQKNMRSNVRRSWPVQMNPVTWHPYESGLKPRLNKQSKFNFIKIAVQLCRATYTLVQRNMRSNVSRFWGAKLDLFKWTLAANIHISVDWCHTSTLLGGKNNFHYPDFAQSFMSIFGVLQYVLSASDVSMWGCLKNKTKRCFKLKVASIFVWNRSLKTDF